MTDVTTLLSLQRMEQAFINAVVDNVLCDYMGNIKQSMSKSSNSYLQSIVVNFGRSPVLVEVKTVDVNKDVVPIVNGIVKIQVLRVGSDPLDVMKRFDGEEF